MAVQTTFPDRAFEERIARLTAGARSLDLVSTVMIRSSGSKDVVRILKLPRRRSLNVTWTSFRANASTASESESRSFESTRRVTRTCFPVRASSRSTIFWICSHPFSFVPEVWNMFMVSCVSCWLIAWAHRMPRGSPGDTSPRAGSRSGQQGTSTLGGDVHTRPLRAAAAIADLSGESLSKGTISTDFASYPSSPYRKVTIL